QARVQRGSGPGQVGRRADRHRQRRRQGRGLVRRHQVFGTVTEGPLWSLDGTTVELRGGGHYVAPGATLIGRVVLEDRATVWFGAILRADSEPIVIGPSSNVQDGAVLH